MECVFKRIQEIILIFLAKMNCCLQHTGSKSEGTVARLVFMITLQLVCYD